MAFVPVLGLLLAVPLAGCAFFADPGPKTTEQRTISNVTAVQLKTSGDLTIAMGETPNLTITAGANQLPSLTSEVRDGTLILDADLRRGDGISYLLTVPSLRSLEVSGSGNANGSVVLSGEAAVTSTGSGSLQLTGVAADSIVVDLTGSGDVELAGSAPSQQLTITGSGTFNGSALVTRDADITITGSGDARVNASGHLTARSTGSGDVIYTGNPTNVTATTTGSGGIGPQ